MEKKLRSVLSGAGFYAVLSICLVIVAAGGYFAFRRQSGERPAAEDLPPNVAADAPAPNLYVPEEIPEGPAVPEPEAAETVSPEALEALDAEETPAMPEAEIDPAPVVVEAPRLIVNPLRGDVVMAFSVDELLYSPTLADWRIHDGVDISAKPGTTVMAASPGTVAEVTDDPMMGTQVTIEHQGGYVTVYANLQETPAVAEGDYVSAGQIIGAVGTTASAEASQSPHLHFAVRKDGVPVNPDDFLNQ